MSIHDSANEHAYLCQEVLAAGIVRGRREERQRACLLLRQVVYEIAQARFPSIADFLRENVDQVEDFSVLYQFNFVLGTAWTTKDVLRFVLALDDGAHAPL